VVEVKKMEVMDEEKRREENSMLFEDGWINLAMECSQPVTRNE
jgi:hypothetical protein